MGTAKKMTSVGIRDTQHPVLAVCSGIRKEEHGTCNVNTGLCSGCYAGTTEALTPAFQSVNCVDTVPQKVRTSFPYSGAQGKCEEWFVPPAGVDAPQQSAEPPDGRRRLQRLAIYRSCPRQH